MSEQDAKKEEILAQELDNNELDTVSGGYNVPQEKNIKVGGCTSSHYREQCVDTVDNYRCAFNDWCSWLVTEYTVV